jgi:hypothetical protein
MMSIAKKITLSDTRQTKPGKNLRRINLILRPDTETTNVFELFGWNDLPEKLKEAVRTDLNAYRDELLGLYSTCDPAVLNRRKSVSYWIKAYRRGLCSEETAEQALSGDAALKPVQHNHQAE